MSNDNFRIMYSVIGHGTDAFIDLMKDLVERCLDYIDDAIDDGEVDFDTAVNEALDSGMIYTDDQWTAYRHYCDMGDDPQIMWEDLFNDLYTIVAKIEDLEQ